MKTSTPKEVRQLYEDTAEGYAEMMDAEIDLPVYADTLGRLAGRVAELPGPIIDTSCGSGHMLARYRERHEPGRPLIAVDLSPRMIAIARSRLGPSVEAFVGDMRAMEEIESGSAAAALSFFALHHLDPEQVRTALEEWHRVLAANGQVVIAAWEGQGAIDYGGETDVVALRFTEEELSGWVAAAGFAVDRCVVEPVEEMPMDAIYLEASKKSGG